MNSVNIEMKNIIKHNFLGEMVYEIKESYERICDNTKVYQTIRKEMVPYKYIICCEAGRQHNRIFRGSELNREDERRAWIGTFFSLFRSRIFFEMNEHN